MRPPSLPLLRTLRTSTFSTIPSTSSSTSRPLYHLHYLSPRSYKPIHSSTLSRRHLSTFPPRASSSPNTHDRGPPSSESTQTDFSALDVLGNSAPPTSAIDACLSNGFHFDNGLKIADGSGALLVGGEVFAWRPWIGISPGGGSKGAGRDRMLDKAGRWGNGMLQGSWGVLELCWPKPDMLILGLGASIYPLAPETRRYINSLGIRVDVQDTRNAAAQFNLLATERGVENIAAALIPIGWKGGA